MSHNQEKSTILESFKKMSSAGKNALYKEIILGGVTEEMEPSNGLVEHWRGLVLGKPENQMSVEQLIKRLHEEVDELGQAINAYIPLVAEGEGEELDKKAGDMQWEFGDVEFFLEILRQRFGVYRRVVIMRNAFKLGTPRQPKAEAR